MCRAVFLSCGYVVIEMLFEVIFGLVDEVYRLSLSRLYPFMKPKLDTNNFSVLAFGTNPGRFMRI
jgi:hypothetical protein